MNDARDAEGRAALRRLTELLRLMENRRVALSQRIIQHRLHDRDDLAIATTEARCLADRVEAALSTPPETPLRWPLTRTETTA